MSYYYVLDPLRISEIIKLNNEISIADKPYEMKEYVVPRKLRKEKITSPIFQFQFASPSTIDEKTIELIKKKLQNLIHEPHKISSSSRIILVPSQKIPNCKDVLDFRPKTTIKEKFKFRILSSFSLYEIKKILDLESKKISFYIESNFPVSDVTLLFEKFLGPFEVPLVTEYKIISPFDLTLTGNVSIDDYDRNKLIKIIQQSIQNSLVSSPLKNQYVFQGLYVIPPQKIELIQRKIEKKTKKLIQKQLEIEEKNKKIEEDEQKKLKVAEIQKNEIENEIKKSRDEKQKTKLNEDLNQIKEKIKNETEKVKDREEKRKKEEEERQKAEEKKLQKLINEKEKEEKKLKEEQEKKPKEEQEQKLKEEQEKEKKKIQELQSLVGVLQNEAELDIQKEVLYVSLGTYRLKGIKVEKATDLNSLLNLEKQLKRVLNNNENVDYEFFKALEYLKKKKQCQSKVSKSICDNINEYAETESVLWSLDKKLNYLKFYMKFTSLNLMYHEDKKLVQIMKEWEKDQTKFDFLLTELQKFEQEKKELEKSETESKEEGKEEEEKRNLKNFIKALEAPFSDEEKKRVIYNTLLEYSKKRLIQMDENAKNDLNTLHTLENELEKKIGEQQYLTYEYYKAVGYLNLSSVCTNDEKTICENIREYLYNNGNSFSLEKKYKYLHLYYQFTQLSYLYDNKSYSEAHTELLEIMEKWNTDKTQIDLVLTNLEKFELETQSKEAEKIEKEEQEKSETESKEEGKEEEKKEEETKEEKIYIKDLKTLVNVLEMLEPEEKQKEIIYNQLFFYSPEFIQLDDKLKYDLNGLHSKESELKKKLGKKEYVTYEFYKGVAFAKSSFVCDSEEVRDLCASIESYLNSNGDSFTFEKKYKYLNFYESFISLINRYPKDNELFEIIENWKKNPANIDFVVSKLEKFRVERDSKTLEKRQNENKIKELQSLVSLLQSEAESDIQKEVLYNNLLTYKEQKGIKVGKTADLNTLLAFEKELKDLLKKEDTVNYEFFKAIDYLRNKKQCQSKVSKRICEEIQEYAENERSFWSLDNKLNYLKFYMKFTSLNLIYHEDNKLIQIMREWEKDPTKFDFTLIELRRFEQEKKESEKSETKSKEGKEEEEEQKKEEKEKRQIKEIKDLVNVLEGALDEETKKEIIYRILSYYVEEKLIELREDEKYDLNRLRSVENVLKEKLGETKYVTYEFYKGLELIKASEVCKSGEAKILCQDIYDYLYANEHSFSLENKYKYLDFYSKFIVLTLRYLENEEVNEIIRKWKIDPAQIDLRLAELEQFQLAKIMQQEAQEKKGTGESEAGEKKKLRKKRTVPHLRGGRRHFHP